MQKQVTGLNRTLYTFSLNEKEAFEKIMDRNKGFATEIFINNGYAVEIKKRTI